MSQMKVLIAHKNRIFYDLLVESGFHKCNSDQVDYVHTGKGLLESLDGSYDLILTGLDLFGFSAIDAFNLCEFVRPKVVVLLDSKEDFVLLDYLGDNIALFDCSLEPLTKLKEVCFGEWNKPYVSPSISEYLALVLQRQSEQKDIESPLLNYTVGFILWYINNDKTTQEYAIATNSTVIEVKRKRNELRKYMGSNGIIGILNFAIDNNL